MNVSVELVKPVVDKVIIEMTPYEAQKLEDVLRMAMFHELRGDERRWAESFRELLIKAAKA